MHMAFSLPLFKFVAIDRLHTSTVGMCSPEALKSQELVRTRGLGSSGLYGSREGQYTAWSPRLFRLFLASYKRAVIVLVLT